MEESARGRKEPLHYSFLPRRPDVIDFFVNDFFFNNFSLKEWTTRNTFTWPALVATPARAAALSNQYAAAVHSTLVWVADDILGMFYKPHD